MKIVVIGGTGLIGSKTVRLLQQKGHDVRAASPASGVNAVTGQGLAVALAGADIVVDVSNSPSFADADVMAFFENSARNLAKAEKEAGVKQHVALSVVGTERLLASGYFRAKMRQEELIRESGMPYTILRATQFFEFIAAIGQSSVQGDAIRLSEALIQPVASDDVSAAVADVTLAPPVNGMVELAGPEQFKLYQIVGRALEAAGDRRAIVVDPKAPYFGTELNDRSLVPSGPNPRLGTIRYEDWLKK
jgi:uncharacterized protein YbjT (DUF2867 family)